MKKKSRVEDDNQNCNVRNTYNPHISQSYHISIIRYPIYTPDIYTRSIHRSEKKDDEINRNGLEGVGGKT